MINDILVGLGFIKTIVAARCFVSKFGRETRVSMLVVAYLAL